jgi:TM2 domain-containing membrane protein YozV
MSDDPNSKDSPKDESVDNLKEELGKAEEKIEKMEEKIEEQEKMTSSFKHYKSEGITLVLSIVLGLMGLMGIGHIYVGKVKRGIAILIGGLFIWVIVFIPIGFLSVLEESQELSEEEIMTQLFGPMIGALIIGAIAGFALFIWQILNARSLCRDYNLYCEKKGEPPW